MIQIHTTLKYACKADKQHALKIAFCDEIRPMRHNLRKCTLLHFAIWSIRLKLYLKIVEYSDDIHGTDWSLLKKVFPAAI